MEDLGEAVENFVETFSCTEEESSRLPTRTSPASHGNLLAASPKYGYSFAAVGSSIAVYNHASIRDGDAKPVALVDLTEGNVTCIHALALCSHDNILAHVTIDSKRFVIILNIHALASGRIHALPSPSQEASSFAVGASGLNNSSNALAIVEEGCVQLHSLNTDGSTPSAKISISKPTCAAISPDSFLLAVGTERGSVIIYDAKTGNILTTVVEVESGWVPFSVHFADERGILVSYNCDAEVRHVVWHLSPDGTAVSGHSALGEICLASLSFESDDDDSDEVPPAPTIMCISLHEWAMCVIGSSKSGDVEIIKKTDDGWEVWKFDEGKSPTLPNDDNDDDTSCMGLAFDINNVDLIPGPDAASPKINPMPRVIVYTSDYLLLPFALIDGTPGIKCDAVKPTTELMHSPENLRSIQAALKLPAYDQTRSGKNKEETSDIFSEDSLSRLQDLDNSFFPTKTEQAFSKSSGSYTSTTETMKISNSRESTVGKSLRTDEFRTNAAAKSLAFPGFDNDSNSGYDQKGVRSFLGNFSFSETSKADPISPTIPPIPRASERADVTNQLEPTTFRRDQKKSEVSLAPSLQQAEAEANRGDLLGLLKSIITEMSEELRINTEAERLVSLDIASQKDDIVLSITETRKQLSKLLEETRDLFRNETDLRSTVSKTLTNVLAMSREYEKISLEFRVREADGFSRSLRAEERQIDEKISRKETEVIRSITAIEDRLNAEAKYQTRRTSPAEIVQQVYSSLSLQGIRIKRIRSLLTALKERMDNQDKGGRLSHLGLSLARLETLNIHDEVPAQSQSTDGAKRRLSGDRGTNVTNNSVGDDLDITASGIQGDDTQLLSADVRAVMRRLAMSGGRANIATIVPLAKPEPAQRIALTEARVTPVPNGTSVVHPKNNTMITSSTSTEVLATSLPAPKTSAFGSSWSTINAKISHELKDPQQGQDGSSQIAMPFPATSNKFSSYITAEADGRPSDMLPPKKPPSQPLFASSLQSNNTSGFLSSSPPFGNLKKGERNRQSGETVLSKESRLDGNEMIFKVKKGSVNQSDSVASSANTGGLTGYSQSVFESQAKNGVNHDKSSSDVANSISVKPASGPEKSKNAGSIPFAGLPPEDDAHETLENSKMFSPAPVKSALIREEAKKSGAIPFADLPPDDDILESLGKSEGSSPVPVAKLPPADAVPERDSDDTSSSKTPQETAVSHSEGKNEILKNESSSGLFAALPPDTDEERTHIVSREKKAKNSPSSQPQEKKDRVQSSGLFAALPPDPDDFTESTRSGTDLFKGGQGTLAFGASKSGSTQPASQLPKKTGGAFGTNDLFATLPPEDSVKEQTTPLTTFGMGSVIGNNTHRNAMEQAQGSKAEASIAGNKVETHSADAATSSLFRDGPAPKSSAKESIFGSSFETSQRSSAPFGNASLFGANSSTLHSFAGVTEPRISLSMDAASTDDSDEEPTRFDGGMDTTSGRGGAFGASSSVQDNKHPFGFGTSSSEGMQATGFTQSSISPFASFGSSQQFGQTSPSQSSSQPGFGSLAGSQSGFPSSFPASQPAFGEASGFGNASASATFGMQSSFGASSQLGASSSFGTPSTLGATSIPFGSSNSSFGGGVTEAKFGESSFGMTSTLGGFAQNSSGSGFGSSFSSPGASPFGQVAGGNSFGGASGGGSGFAALAGGQSGSLIFGSGNGPPAFTSAAFSQRRA